MVVVGNKSDCNAIREVRSDIATAWARPYGIRTYEVTVMNRDSLKAPFCYIAWRMANPGMYLQDVCEVLFQPALGCVRVSLCTYICDGCCG